MFIGRNYRKKRKVPLLLVQPIQKKQHTMSDWIPPTQNVPSREEDWFRGVYCTHRAFCGCNDPPRHLAALSAAFGFQPAPTPRGGPGPSTTPPVVRGLRALPPVPTRQQPCGGPGGETDGGDQREGGDGGAAGELPPEDVEELLDLLDDAE